MTRVAPLRNTFAHLHCRIISPISLQTRSLRLPSSPIDPSFKVSVSSLSRKRIEFPGTWNSSTQLRHSSASSWISITLAGLLGGLVLYTFSPRDIKDSIGGKPTHPRHLTSWDDMATKIPPGRPETLTAAEEEKLREFWVATFKICGVSIHENGEVDADSTKTDTKVKKKKGFLRRLATGGSSSEEVASGPDSNDKFGQVKDYNDALASMSPEAIRDSIWNMVKVENPDAIMLRFLRARKWDVQKALVMMISTMTWRAKDMHVDDDIMKNGELVVLDEKDATDPAKKKVADEMKLQLVTGKSFLHGLDKEGRPMCFIRVRLHRPGEQDIQSIERFTVFQIETARLMMEHPIDTACMVFDMTDFGLANMDYAPIKFIIKCFEANYPESLGVVLIHKAPWVFQGVWKIIKGWLDPVVASKVNFTNNKKELEEYIDTSKIMKELDGSEDFKYQYVEPVPGENDAMKDTETRDRLVAERAKVTADYEKATVHWIRSTGAEREAAQSTRSKLAESLRDGYWKLDPYIRARSNYDRWGVIGPGGRIQFYPDAAPTTKVTNGAEPANPPPKAEDSVKPIEVSADDVD